MMLGGCRVNGILWGYGFSACLFLGAPRAKALPARVLRGRVQRGADSSGAGEGAGQMISALPAVIDWGGSGRFGRIRLGFRLGLGFGFGAPVSGAGSGRTGLGSLVPQLAQKLASMGCTPPQLGHRLWCLSASISRRIASHSASSWVTF